MKIKLIKQLVEQHGFTQKQADYNSICCDGSIDRLKDLISFSVFIHYGWDKATNSFATPSITVYANPLVEGYCKDDRFTGTPEEILNWILNYEPTKLK